MTQIAGIHPHAECYPLLGDEELAALAADIEANGLRDPLTATPDGLLIDGRNRFKACELAGVEPTIVIYKGDDIGAFVRSRNLRRHQPVGSLAMSTALSMLTDGLRGEGRWKRDSTANQESLNSDWKNKLTQCGVVLDFKPDLAPAVVAGDLALDAAFQQAKAIKDSAERDKIMAREKAKREKQEAAAEAERNAQIVADLTQAGAVIYLDMIDTGTMTPKAAWAAHREDTRKEREAADRAREVLRDRYTSMANACLTAASWGEHDDLQALMADYEPALLNPPQLERYLSLESLLAVQRFAEELITWRKSL